MKKIFFISGILFSLSYVASAQKIPFDPIKKLGTLQPGEPRKVTESNLVESEIAVSDSGVSSENTPPPPKEKKTEAPKSNDKSKKGMPSDSLNPKLD